MVSMRRFKFYAMCLTSVGCLLLVSSYCQWSHQVVEVTSTRKPAANKVTFTTPTSSLVFTQSSSIHVPHPLDTVHRGNTTHTGIHAPVLNIATAAPLREQMEVREVVRTGQGFVLDFSQRKDTSTIVQVTQNDNLDTRSKWQMQQVTKFCKKYGQERDLYVLPVIPKQRTSLFRHLIDSSDQKFLFCFLPKTGCTTLRRLMFVMLHVIPSDTIYLKEIPESILRLAIKQTSFQRSGLTDKQKINKIKTYFKFVMIRHPLERLVSAYRSKIQPPLEFTDHDQLHDPLIVKVSGTFPYGMDFFQAQRRMILSKYHPEELIEWAKNRGSYNISVNFPTYVQWIIDTPDQYLNEHFSSIPFNAAPCRVGYHLYLNFKNYSREVRLMIKALNVSTDYFIDQSEHTKNDETRNTLPYYFSKLSSELKEKLFHRMYKDLDFYYHLYPEDQWSHVELLGVTLPVLTGPAVPHF